MTFLDESHPVDDVLDDTTLAKRFIALMVKAGGLRRSATIFVQLRGLDGGAPQSLRQVQPELSGERIRQLVKSLEEGPLQRLLASGSDELIELKKDIKDLLRRIEKHAPGSDHDIRDALASDFVRTEAAPASVVRLADILGVHHNLRLTTWSARAKYADPDGVKLASNDASSRRDQVVGIVPDNMPEVFENFMNFARKFTRGAGVASASHLAERYGVERGVPLAPNEVVAFLRPFAVHLGRHDGDEWFTFFNSANDFISKTKARVDILTVVSFESLRQFHQRFNRSLYASGCSSIPDSVLRAALELAGYQVNGDDVRPMEPLGGQKGRGLSDIQAQMVEVFRKTVEQQGGGKSLRRHVLVRALMDAGIRESTAQMYLGRQGLFECRGGLCRLADTQLDARDQVMAAGTARGRGRPKTVRSDDPAAKVA